MPEGESSYPFKQQPGPEFARGTKYGEFRILEHGLEWILKETRRPEKNTFERLKQDKEDYEFLKSRLGDFVPDSVFIRGTNKEGRAVNLVRQRKVKGRNLCDIPEEEILKNEQIRENLADFFERCVRMWEEDGRMPDIIGNSKPLLEQLDPFKTTNVMIEDDIGKVFLVDTSAPQRYFSKNSLALFRLRNKIVIKNAQKFIDKVRPPKSPV